MSYLEEEIVWQKTNGGPVRGHRDRYGPKYIRICDYCGNDIPKGDQVLLQHDKEYHGECLRKHIPWCNEAVEEVSKIHFNDHVLSMAIHVKVLYGTKHQDINRRVKRYPKHREFINKVSALRNSNSGILLIHLVGLDAQDTYIGAFNEFADIKLQGLINDGSLFTDVYKKQRLSQREGLEKFTDILVLYVEGSRFLVTSDFKTKLTLDDCVIDIQDSTFISFLRARKEFKEVKFNDLTATHAEDLCSLQQSRHIHTKAYYEQGTGDDNIVTYMLEGLRLSEYISAFSKLDHGGSYLLGLTETENHFDYRSRKMTVRSVVIDDCQAVVELITNCVCESCLVCDYDGNVKASDTLVETTFIPSKDNTGYVIHVFVRPVSGVVFCDKEGPEAYKLNPKNPHSIVRLTFREWFNAFKKSFDQMERVE